MTSQGYSYACAKRRAHARCQPLALHTSHDMYVKAMERSSLWVEIILLGATIISQQQGQQTPAYYNE